ncbi:MAG: zinc-dependent alcohol dehydrogenase [Verrucomicrobiales bacterium]
MRALTLKAYSEFDLGDVPVPDLGPEDVLVRVKACGICGSDIHGFDGTSGRRIPPIIMGHEASGVIHEAGNRVDGWKPGDRVTFDSTVYCGQCKYCRQGLVNLCQNRRVLGVSCGDYRQHGAFAEFVKIPARILYRLPERLTFEQAAFCEPLSIALHAVNRVSVKQGDTALVIGAGVIGLLVLQALKLKGCGRVFISDLSEARLEVARHTGADETFVADRVDVVEEVLRLTDGEGADIAMECVGFSVALNTAIDAVRKGGHIGLVGNLQPRCDFPLQKVVTRELSLFGSCASSGEYQTAVDALAAGQIDIQPLLSATAPLEQGPDWFKRLHSGKEPLIKVILQP